MKIKLLSPLTISRIAAGEVVERPASAIKELVENSIDAGANEINILIHQSGRNLISISDNGSGMNQADLTIAADRHTTSKLNEEDIFNIKQFGFRGEALPSIASVSRLNITSRDNLQNNAWSIDIIGGDKGEIYPASLTSGTKIEVRDLFFATPARLKFLKSERTELQYIIDIVDKIAMANHGISFILATENKMIAKYKAQKVDDKMSRIKEILGDNFIDNSVYINETHNNIKVNGFVSIPTFNKSAPTDQYFFVNNRPVKDKLLNISLKIAYQDFISNDRYPIAVIFLNLPPEEVDVNVHPTKSEVRFRDSINIRSIVVNAIKNAISSTLRTSTTFVNKFISNINRNNENISTNNQILSESKIGYSYPKTNNTALTQQNFFKANIEPTVKISNDKPKQDNYSHYPLGAAVCQLHETYLISQTEDSVIIVDQHAAHERLVYEKLKANQNSLNLKKQRLLIPEIIELDNKRFGKIIEIKEQLKNFGLNIEQFGDDIIINEVPTILEFVNIQELMKDLADELLEYEENLSLPKLVEQILETFACHNSIRAGKKLNLSEINELLRDIESTQGASQCNHGRPTYVKLKLTDIEKLFKRS